MLEIQAIIITSTQAICPFVTTSTLLANILTFGKRRTLCIYALISKIAVLTK